jgi:hypothetical protein
MSDWGDRRALCPHSVLVGQIYAIVFGLCTPVISYTVCLRSARGLDGFVKWMRRALGLGHVGSEEGGLPC